MGIFRRKTEARAEGRTLWPADVPRVILGSVPDGCKMTPATARPIADVYACIRALSDALAFPYTSIAA